ncbi:hypothetical protein ACFL4Z_02140 [candidate division KSB1 bacterium]
MIDLLSQISLAWVKVIIFVIFLSLVVWMWLTPKEYIFKSSPDNSKWRDLRIWGTLIILAQSIIYLIF